MKYLRLLSLIWNVQLVQCIADYLVQATLDQLTNLVFVNFVVRAVVLTLSQLSVVRAKPMEMPHSWPFHIRLCIANELRLTHQIRKRMLLPPHTLLTIQYHLYMCVCTVNLAVHLDICRMYSEPSMRLV